MGKPKSIKNRVLDQLPTMQLPTLGKTVDIPVYVIHNSSDSEDYFFIFDFEQFVERSRAGMFVRPRLQIWAGRQDFARRKFARQFRESFSNEFEAARVALKGDSSDDVGWFGQVVGLGLGLAANTVPGLVALIVLSVATAAGSAIWSVLPNRPRMRKVKSDDEKLEESITETQVNVDKALGAMAVTLHPELYKHAYLGSKPGPKLGMDENAWPLPEFVSRHLNTRN